MFYKMTLGHFQLFAEGYQIREARQWERARYVASVILNSVGNDVKAADLFELCTDNREKSDPKRTLTHEEVEYFIKRIEQVKSWN